MITAATVEQVLKTAYPAGVTLQALQAQLSASAEELLVQLRYLSQMGRIAKRKQLLCYSATLQGVSVIALGSLSPGEHQLKRLLGPDRLAFDGGGEILVPSDGDYVLMPPTGAGWIQVQVSVSLLPTAEMTVNLNVSLESESRFYSLTGVSVVSHATNATIDP